MKDAMDKLLREAVARERDITPQTVCLDADTAAALAEGTLASRDRAAAEAHIAGCAHCQTMIAALARTLPPVLSDVEGATPAPVWWRRPAFMWLAPLTAVGAALVVWAAVPQRESASLPVQPSIRPSAESSPLAAPPLKEESRAAAAGAPSSFRVPAATDQRELSARRDAELMRQRTLADSRTATPIAPPPAPAPAAASEQQQASTMAGAASVPTPPPAPPLQSKPLPPAAVAGAAAADTAAPQIVTESVAIGPAAARQSLMRSLASETVIISPNSTRRWRIGTGGVVQHSRDGGTTWQTQTTGVNVSLVAGSSPSETVCWLVGPAGTIVVTADGGRSWQRTASPAPVDLRSVRATDDKTASVFAADGRQFSTSDGGATWHPR